MPDFRSKLICIQFRNQLILQLLLILEDILIYLQIQIYSLRVVWKHMMNAMHNVMQISHHSVIKQVFFAVENESMKQIFSQREGKYSQYECQQQNCYFATYPICIVKQICDEQQRKNVNMIPFVMRQRLKRLKCKHLWRGNKKPMRRINYSQISLVIHIPYLRHQSLVRIYVFSDLFLEGSDYKRISHSQSQRLMSFHLFCDVFCLIVQNKTCSSRMMLSECSCVKNIVVVNHQNFVIFCGIVLYLFHVFKFHVFLHLNLILLILLKVDLIAKYKQKHISKIIKVSAVQESFLN